MHAPGHRARDQADFGQIPPTSMSWSLSSARPTTGGRDASVHLRGPSDRAPSACRPSQRPPTLTRAVPSPAHAAQLLCVVPELTARHLEPGESHPGQARNPFAPNPTLLTPHTPHATPRGRRTPERRSPRQKRGQTHKTNNRSSKTRSQHPEKRRPEGSRVPRGDLATTPCTRSRSPMLSMIRTTLVVQEIRDPSKVRPRPPALRLAHSFVIRKRRAS